MPTDSRGLYDVVVDRVVDALTAYRDEQSAIDPGVSFRVQTGGFRPQQSVKVPIVTVALSSIRSANESSRAREWEIEATYNIDVIASGRATQADRGDKRATARLMYLVQQVLNGMYASDRRAEIERDGVTIEWPDVQVVEPESFAEEAPLIGARLTFQARMVYTPPVTDGQAIDKVSVDAARWGGLYEYGG